MWKQRQSVNSISDNENAYEFNLATGIVLLYRQYDAGSRLSFDHCRSLFQAKYSWTVLPRRGNVMPFYGNQVRERIQRTLNRHGNFEMISDSKVLHWSE